jgi:hypothetical protein
MNLRCRGALLALLCGCCLLAAGCSRRARVRGKITKWGQPVTVVKGKGMIAVTFHLLEEEGKPPINSFPATADPETGTYEVTDSHGKGIPRGKYRITVQVFEEYGEAAAASSAAGATAGAIVRDVQGGRQELNIDLNDLK